MRKATSESLAGYVFIGPSISGYLLFVLGPLIAAIALSFTRYDVLTAPRLVGLGNYTRLLNDPRLATVYRNTTFFAVTSVVLTVSLGVVLAVAVNQRLPGPLKYVLRTVYFFPVLVGMIYAAMVWKFLFNKDLGVVNFYLHFFNVPPIGWLTTSNWALWSVILVYVWKNVGFTMLTTLAGLQNIPQELYEAARIDGAQPITAFFRLTVPLLTPVLLFNVSITMINTLQEFDSIVALTNGGPGDASRSVVMYIYDKAFRSFDMGYASAIAVTLFALIALLTGLQFWASRRWVHYG
ncbi:MAG: sugar ABC transporter permease [Acidobacteria bacterium]|nr:MAG: sugar ABC transporter permease [Acidobacteriota bacterium]